MKMNRKIYFVIFFIFLLSYGTSIFAQNESIEDLEKLYESKKEYKQEVYDKTLAFIQQNPQVPDIANLYYNLANMSVEINANDLPKTIGFFQKVLEIDPDFPNKDDVYYNIGYFSFENIRNNRDNARIENRNLIMNWPDSLRLSREKLSVPINAYMKIVEETPESEYYTEALYRLGTIFFEIAIDSRNPMEQYPKALKFFDIVASKDGDKFQTFGLFQRGWTYFSSGQYDKAIEDFTSILEFISRQDEASEKVYFEADAIENIAFSLIEADGTEFNEKSQAAQKAKELFTDFISEEYAKEVLLDAVDLKLKYSAPMQAIDMYNAYIEIFPTDIMCPAYVDSIMKIYSRNPKRTRNNQSAKDMIIQQKIRIVNEYSVDSDWYQENKDKSIDNQLAIIREAYEFIAPSFHNQLAKNPSIENYERYKMLVENYAQFSEFQDEVGEKNIKEMRKRIVDATFIIANKNNDPTMYFIALDNFDDYNESYPQNNFEMEFKSNKFYCYEQIYSLLHESIVDTAYVDTVNQITLNKDSLDSLYISATHNYEELLKNENYTKDNKSDELIRVISQRASIHYNREEFDLAFQDYQELLNYEIPAELSKRAYSVMAEISQQNGDYTASEQYYRNAAQFAQAEEKKDFENNILATIKLSADNMADTENFESAALEYLRLSEELRNTNLDQSVSYIYKAIEVYEKIGNYQKAIDLFLQIASLKTDKLPILAAYKGAWTISDSLQDWTQSELIRNQFIDRFPTSNEAYALHLKNISFYENEQFNDKEKAAEMYLALYNNSTNIDMGEDRREDLYLKAVAIYQELGMNDRYIELVEAFAEKYPNNEITPSLLKNVAIMYSNDNNIDAMLAFEKKYPNHPTSIELLKTVAKLYKDENNDAKFEEMAKYIYKKDPSIDLLTDIARDKLIALHDEISENFNNKNYDIMREKIAEFKAMDKQYQSDGISLPLETIYDQFTYYDNYIDYYKRFDKKMEWVDANIISANPNVLIRVNDKTTWDKHLNGGANRLPNLMKLCERAEKEVLAMWQEGANFNIPFEKQTQAIYYIAKSYDRSGEVVKEQVQKFIDVSTQLNNPALEKNPIKQKTIKTRLVSLSDNYSLEFKKKAISYYKTIQKEYIEGKDYRDEWVDLTEQRLEDWGLLKEREAIPIYSMNTWKVNSIETPDYQTALMQDSIWEQPSVVDDRKEFDQADVFILPNQITYIPVEYAAEIRPDYILIEYSSNADVGFTINEMPLDRGKASEKEMITINDVSSKQYEYKISRNLVQGNNQILITVNPVSEINYFAARITGMFDKEKLEFYRNTEEHYLYSDYSWYVTKENVNKDNIMIDSTWTFAGEGNLSFYKPQMHNMETTEAIPIWHPDRDSINVSTIYIYKEFTVPAYVHQATMKFIGQKNTSLWLNNTSIVENMDLIYDTALNKAESNEIVINDLRIGKNTILVKVTGEIRYKGFIFELHYISDKVEEVGYIPSDENSDKYIEQKESEIVDKVEDKNPVNVTEVAQNVVDETVQTVMESSDENQPEDEEIEDNISQITIGQKADEGIVSENIEDSKNEVLEDTSDTIQDDIEGKVEEINEEVGQQIETEDTEENVDEITVEDTAKTIQEDNEIDRIEMPDESQVEYVEQSPKMLTLSSDESWLTSLEPPEMVNFQPDSTWKQVKTIDLQLSDELEANLDDSFQFITYPFDSIDGTKKSTFYVKQIDINSGYMQGSLKIATNRYTEVYVNGEIQNTINTEDEMVVSEKDITLTKGSNYLLISLYGLDENSAFGLVYDYQISE